MRICAEAIQTASPKPVFIICKRFMESVALVNLQSHFHIILRVVFLFGIFYRIEVTPILSVQQPDPYVRIKFIAAICRGTMHHRNINFILCTRQRRQREIEKLKFAYIKFPNQGVAFFVFLRSKGFRYVRKVLDFFIVVPPLLQYAVFWFSVISFYHRFQTFQQKMRLTVRRICIL